ncbi:MAG TPA: hypothetical protein VFT27_00990 [Actinomycetota bacterium]|nr:hypothetical protein [Actinomycetota bacterium]
MRATRLPIAAFVAAVAGALIAAFAPLGRTCGTTFPGNQTTCSGTSTFSVDGWWVLVVVSVPVAISLLPILLRRRPARIASAVLLWISCVVGMWSVGVFFVPAAILMTVAATKRDVAPAGAIT